MLKNPHYVYGSNDLLLPGNLNFGEFMLNNLWKNKEKIGLINGLTHETLTCGEIAQEAMTLAMALTDTGVRKGDVVAVCSENRREFFPTVIGIACSGAVVTTFNTSYSKDELLHVMDISKPKYFFCSPELYNTHANSLKSLDYVKKIIIFGGAQGELNILLYNDLVGTHPNSKQERKVKFEEFDVVNVQGQTDTLFILYSSGTTGLPKGVMLTHLNVMALCSLTFETDREPIRLSITPWFHANGLMGTLKALISGGRTVYLPKFDKELYLKTIEYYKVTHLLTVPPILVTLCKYQSNHDISSVKQIFCAAAPLHSDTIDAVRARFPKVKAVLQGYGMTETTLGITRDTYEDIKLAKPGGVGYIAKCSVIKIIDIETKKPLGPNQKGEIYVKGILIMKGYIGKDRRDDFDEEGFFRTGDIGYYDEDKYFYVVDRLKEIIKYNGYQVAPMELEAVLLKHPDVRDAGVVGIPHAVTGEVPLAFVVPQPSAKLTETELQQFVAEKLSSKNHLRGGVRFVTEIPKNPSGKILRKNLREMAKTINKL